MLNHRARRANFARMTEDDRLVDTIPAFRVGQAVSDVIRKVVKEDRRTISDVARALLERGVAAYLRDGKLFEPPSSNGAQDAGQAASDKPSTISVSTKNLGGKKGGRKREAS